MCVRECATESVEQIFPLFVHFFCQSFLSSFCHSPRLNVSCPNCHRQFFSSRLFFTSQYELSDRADYKSNPKFVVPPLRLQNHNFQAAFVLFHFSCCLSSALLVFTHLLSSPLLSSPHFNTLFSSLLSKPQCHLAVVLRNPF